MLRTPTYIMVHHSLTEDGSTVSWPAIEKYHIETNKWKDIGYHAGVELITDNPDLSKYKYQALIGRSIEQNAAACPQGNMNEVALHVCCVGNYDFIPPSDEMLYILVTRVIRPWSLEFNIPPERWVGHRDYNKNKTCPGTKFDLDHLRSLVVIGR